MRSGPGVAKGRAQCRGRPGRPEQEPHRDVPDGGFADRDVLQTGAAGQGAGRFGLIRARRGECGQWLEASSSAAFNAFPENLCRITT